MTTYFPFQQPANGIYTFRPTLDGSLYTVYVTWNLFAQRYYVNIYDLSGSLVVCIPRVSSPPAITTASALNGEKDISLTAGYFASTLVWRDDSQQFEVSP